jgi:exosome complex component RRP41
MAGTGDVPLFRADGKRLDGRDVKDLRRVKLEVGVLPQADGSAYIEMGNNKIIVAAYGPREIHPKHLSLPDRLRVRAEYRLATFSVNERKSPAPKRREIELSKMIQEALEPSIFTEKFPRSTIDLYILVLDADGGTRAASITAASLALADAGLPLRGLVSSVAAGKVGDKIVLDLSDEEDKYGSGDLPIAMISQNKEITLLQADGQFTPEEVRLSVELAMEGCEQLYIMQRDVLLAKYKEISEQLKDGEADVETLEDSEDETSSIEDIEDDDNSTYEPTQSDDSNDDNDEDNLKDQVDNF